MAMNLEAVLRIAAKVVGLENITALEKGIQGAEKAAGEAKGAFKAVVGSSAWQAAAAAATGFGVAIGLAARAAIDFESSMADVRKVVNGLESPQALAEIKSEIMGLTRILPLAADEVAAIYTAAGQSGIAREELEQFALVVGKTAVAFDMTAEEAGRSLAQMRAALGLTTPQLELLGDAINYISNNSKGALTAGNLVEFMTRAGAMGKIAGFSGQQTAALGGAMIQSGIQAEVAATSFNNMVKALSKGQSMTDRQKSALSRLGYTMVDAQAKEKELTRVAEEQSRRRLEAARNETDQLTKEINRRYRNMQQALQDTWDDESAAYEDGLQDRADAQIKAIQREQERVIEAAQARAEATGTSAKVEIENIQDMYQSRIEAIRDTTERELNLRRRADRNRQQAVKDQLEDQKDLEIKGVDDRYKAIEDAEKQALDAAKDQAKKTGEKLAADSAQGFADRFQQDAVGTMLEVFKKIASLPRSQQISVLSDFAGDEARGLALLLGNLGELERMLALVANESEYAGSVSKEFEIRMQSAAENMKLFNNAMRDLQVVIGDVVLPYITQFVKWLTPMVDGVIAFAKANPGMTATLVTIGSIVSALVLAAPFILSAFTLIAKISGALAGIAKVAAFAAGAIKFAFVSGLIPALQGVLAWIGSTLIPGLLAFFSGPIGWTVLAVAAVVAMAIAFREPLMKFVAWLWNWGEPIRQFWAGLWNGLVQFVGYSLTTIGTLIANGAKRWWQGVTGVWQAIGKGFMTYVVDPISKAWTAVMGLLPKVMNSAAEAVSRVWNGVVNGVKAVINGLLGYVASRINSIASMINRLIAGFNSLPGPDLPFVPTFTVPAFAQGGLVSRPTLAMVGEGGEREYIVPESKMATASSRFLAGSRGADVIPSSSGAGSSSRAPVINITTGPVLEFDGQRYVRMEDLEKAMRVTADGVIGRLRTPAARIALGRA